MVRGVGAEGEEAEGDRSVFSVGPGTNRTLVYAVRVLHIYTYLYATMHTHTHTHKQHTTCTRIRTNPHTRDACRARCGEPRARGKSKVKDGQRCSRHAEERERRRHVDERKGGERAREKERQDDGQRVRVTEKGREGGRKGEQ